MKFDDILQNYVGEFGSYQKRIYFLVCLPSAFAAIFTLLPIFILITPDHRCHHGGLDNDTYAYQSDTHRQLVDMSVPRDDEDKLSECYLYNLRNGTSPANASKSTCDEWVYDTHYTTAVSQYNMVCEFSIYQSHFKMISFLGGLIGAFLNGMIADIFGRKRAFLTFLPLYMVVTIILILSPNYSLFLAMRFFQGLFGIGIFMISFVMVMELVGPNYRMLAGMVIEFFWCFGLFVLVAAAYFIHSWIHLLLAVSLPCVAFFSYFWIIPESPRWLLSRGRIDEAEKILKKTASVNGTSFPERLVLENVRDEETRGKTEQQQSNEAGHVWKLFTNRVLLVRMIIIIINRFTLNMSYYGLWLNIESLSGNVYMNFTISSAVETLANLFILLFINRLGRKPLYCGSMIVSALGFLLTLFPIYLGGEATNIYGLGLVMIGKFGITAAYSIIIIYVSELVPTSVRNSAMGLTQCIEVFGGVLSPYIIDVGNLFDERSSKAFPMMVFGAFSLVSGLLSLLLPETRHKQLPETMEEAARFGRHQEL